MGASRASLRSVAFASFLLMLGAIFLWIASSSTNLVGLLISLHTGLILVVTSVTAFIAYRRHERFFRELEHASRKLAWPMIGPMSLAGFLLILLSLMGVKLPVEEPMMQVMLHVGTALGLGLLMYLCLLVVRISVIALRNAESSMHP